MIQKTLYVTQNLSNGIAVAAESHWIGFLDLKITITIFSFQLVGKYDIIFNINKENQSKQALLVSKGGGLK